MGGGGAVIFPLAMSAAAQRTDKTPEENVASLAQFVFVIFLLAPPILGLPVAEYAGLRWSFALCFPLSSAFLQYIPSTFKKMKKRTLIR